MRTIWTIAVRELQSYFRSTIAYVFLISFVALNAFLFFRSFFLVGQADLHTMFILIPWIFLFFVPAVAMGQWSEEIRQGTLELLLTMPIPEWQYVLGKFIAGMGLITTALLGTLPIAFVVDYLGPLDWGVVITSYLGLLGVGGVFLSLGLSISALTRNQIVAFIGGVLGSFALFIVGEPIITMVLPTKLASIVQTFGVSFHFGSMARGVLDTRDLLYFGTVIAMFLWINCEVVRGRRI